MNRRLPTLLHCLLVCLCAAPLVVVTATTSAQPGSWITVDEAATRFALAADAGTVSLAVGNAEAHALNAHFEFELLDPTDKIVSSARADAVLKRGANRVEATLAIPTALRSGAQRRELIWYRLRYRVEPDAHTSAFNPVSGVVSLSAVTRDLFELRVAASKRVREGQLLRVRVRATHPLTERAVRGVKLEGEVEFDDDEKGDTQKINARGETDADGYASLDFQLPRAIPDDDVELSVTGKLGSVEQEESDSLDLDRRIRVLVSTDKPLYQPGQTMHLRALVVTNADRALASAEGTLKIEDPEGTTVFDTPIKTSRFGVASCDWKLADNTRLGDYAVTVELDEDKYGDAGNTGHARVKISRYDLPNFTVAAKPDRDYYLRGEGAAVEVRADYLFGQPVKRARVRVVRESERSWNYAEQKYDVEEGDKYEGELDEAGRFTARVDLSKAHTELTDSPYRRFTDLTFAAYVTDPTTNRTEQRRFSLRVTRDPVHIYVTQANTRQARGLPLEFYVATSYADGSPAQCEVKIEERPAEQARQSSTVAAPARAWKPIVKTVRTNRFGVARVSGPVVARDGDSGEGSLSLRFTARDRVGREGSHDDTFWMNSDPVIRVKTDKSIYREGESVAAEISSDKPDLKVIVEVVADNRTLYAETVRLSNGRASLSIPYRPEFQNRVTVAAYTAAIPDNTYDDDFIKGTRTIIYPRDRELNLDVKFGSASYKPGEEASARFQVKDARGRTAESALGVVVFDKAVEERARTEQEFASSYGFYDQFRSFWYGDDAVGGYTLRDIERLDATKPVSAELDLVAEMLLQREDDYEPNFFGGGDYETDQSRVFAKLAEEQLKSARRAVSLRYERTGDYPHDEASLRRALADAGLAPDVRDPWGTPYRGAFSVEQANDVVEFASAGADKRFGTADDWKVGRMQFPYFRPQGEALNRAVEEYQRRTGTFLRDAATLKQVLREHTGIDFDALRDRWGKPYELRFAINGTNYFFTVESAGPDGHFNVQENPSADDFPVWSIWTDYFAEPRTQIDSALTAFLKETNGFPKDEATLRAVLRRVGMRFEELRDPWEHPFYVTFRTEGRYADRTQTEQQGGAGAHTQVTPITRQLSFVAIRSAGADGYQGTYDDFTAAEFSAIASDQSAHDAKPVPAEKITVFASGTGALSGTVTDPQGASVPNATVTATHQYLSDKTFNATTDAEGVYLLRNLPPGIYTVTVDAPGFKRAVVMGITVSSESLARVDLRMEVGGVMETVTVTADSAGMVEQTSSSISTRQILELPLNGRRRDNLALLQPGVVERGKVRVVTRSGAEEIATPRLRDKFSETLFWQPELVTDRQGRSEVKFKLADNITTWKMSVIGSNERGEIGTAEREFRAFQPFFVELDPPPVLTEGDEINLPVVVRNYLDTPQRVALDLKPESWFTLLAPATRATQVAAGDSARETFPLRAVASVKEGKQRVTARGETDADAIEKTTSVHPDGEEVAQTTTQLVGSVGALDVNVPASVVPHSLHAELKIYPNLLSHVIEGVEAIMKRPYGCGEQTISSTYPSVFILRHYKQLKTDDAQLPPVAAKAREYLRAGYERLLSYHAADGGFTYWGRGDSDVALTAYAIRFLEDARDLTEIDDSVLESARAWLLRQQRADGSWAPHTWNNTPDPRGEAMLTAYVARVLARGERRAGGKTGSQATSDANNSTNPINATAANGATISQPPAQTPLKPPSPFARSLDYLARRAMEIDEPYLLAAYALALADSNASPDKLDAATRRLRSLARDEGEGSYFALETNTPFYGWGLAGRVETTALAVSALARADAPGPGFGGQGSGKDLSAHAAAPSLTPDTQHPAPADDLVSRALLFLLKNKDRYGVWYSTQATVNVLDALMNLSTDRAAEASAQTTDTPGAEVFVNGQSAGVVSLPTSAGLAAPVTLDISRFVAAGANRVEVRRTGSGALTKAAAQVVATYYVPWADAAADGTQSSERSSRALRLAVSFDKTRAAVGEEVTCRVEAERIGHSGYGMLLAEIGLPPGADVDRSSLERAMKATGWDFSHYDVLPDRLVVYLWAHAGGTRFDFTFRPRFGLNAKSASSQAYDYYNPEAQARLAPASFVVTEQAKAATTQAGR
ncbi:MAG: MG2 domain-containing protein [Pyrinomonadaceae bacterium]